MWINSRWGSLTGPDAEVLRNIFQSLSDWTRNPTWGNATNPTISAGGVVQQPSALKVYNEWIQSESFVSGSTGWQIKADGSAEFNNITVRGTFKTAVSGTRVEISSAFSGEIRFYYSTQTNPSYIAAPTTNRLLLNANVATGGSTTQIEMSGYTGSGAASNITIRSGTLNFNGTSATFNGTINATGDLIQFPNTVKDNKINLWGSDYSLGVRSNTLIIRTGAILRVEASGQELVHHSMNSHHFNEGQIVRWSGASGHVTFTYNGQPNYGWMVRSDGALWAMANGTCFVRISGADLVTMSNVGGLLDMRLVSTPALVGTTLVRAGGTGQIGPTSSSADIKKNMRPLSTGSTNPLFKVPVKRFNWDPEKVANGKEVNDRVPDGVAGLVVEDIAPLAPDAVHVDADGKPNSLDERVLIGYLIDGIQHLNQRIRALEKVPANALAKPEIVNE